MRSVMGGSQIPMGTDMAGMICGTSMEHVSPEEHATAMRNANLHKLALVCADVHAAGATK